jgi:hypothetical protein
MTFSTEKKVRIRGSISAGFILVLVFVFVLCIFRPRKLPHAHRVVATSRHDQGLLGPELPFSILFRFCDDDAANGAGMASENMPTFAGLQVPDSRCPIRRAANKRVAVQGKGPNAAFVAFEGSDKLAVGGMYMDQMVI